jgi:metal-dependent HD superfamily phosphatase/phosphodiesterase
LTYDEIKKNKEVCECLKKGNENLGVLGFTDHSAAHCTMVAKRAAYILKKFGYSESDIEMVKIAGFMHDIGNVVNRSRHAEYGAILANEILKETDMSLKDRITVVSAIGHHDESTGGATDPISAALIIADKTDVRRNRVRNKAKENFDIHDRVNYAVTDIRLLPLLFNFSANISVCSVSPDTDNAIVAILSPFPRNTGVNGSSIANENQPTLLWNISIYVKYVENLF